MTKKETKEIEDERAEWKKKEDRLTSWIIGLAFALIIALGAAIVV